uniref:H15 domain-containing protein n=1 Tax=Mola mola TaxID=94237 RepID=A0A3Q3VR37_MOLML
MAEEAPAPAAAAPAKAAKKKTSKPKKSGPSVSELIVKAVFASKQRSGVSLAALKKALAADGYDVEKNKARVRTAIRNLVLKEKLVQVKGSFKLKEGPQCQRAQRESCDCVQGVQWRVFAYSEESPGCQRIHVAKNKARVRTAVRRLVTKSTLVQVKGSKASKKAAEPKAKKPAAKKPAAGAAAAKKSPKKAAKKIPVKKAAKPAAKK